MINLSIEDLENIFANLELFNNYILKDKEIDSNIKIIILNNLRHLKNKISLQITERKYLIDNDSYER